MATETSLRSGPARWLWLGAGWLCVGLGGVGIVVPGFPTTVFFILAASCFARSSPRFEQWVLGLPKIGPLVRDHRAGLGMPLRAKAFAVASIAVASGLSIVLAVDTFAVAAAIAGLALLGIWYVVVRVPTRP